MTNDANEFYELFQSTLLSLFNYHFPLQTKTYIIKQTVNHGLPTPGILTSIRAKRRLEKKAQSNPERYLTIYRRDKNLLTKVTRATRDQYYGTLLETSIGNSKKIWSNINCILGEKQVQSIPPLNSMTFTLLSLKQLQMRSIPILILFL